MNTFDELGPFNKKSTNMSILLNRILYGLFVSLGLYFVSVASQPADGISNFGLALIFDPFDSRIPWNLRPRYQKIWLFVHVGIVLAGLVYLLLFRLKN